MMCREGILIEITISGFFFCISQAFLYACQCLPTKKAKLLQRKNGMPLLKTVCCLAFSVSPLQLGPSPVVSSTLLDHVCGPFSKFGREMLSTVGN